VCSPPPKTHTMLMEKEKKKTLGRASIPGSNPVLLLAAATRGPETKNLNRHVGTKKKKRKGKVLKQKWGWKRNGAIAPLDPIPPRKVKKVVKSKPADHRDAVEKKKKRP